MSHITRIEGREVLDSRGAPTVEVEIECSDGALGRAIVPCGASTGAAEAHELRDGDPARYDGLGVLKAVANVNGEIAGAVVGLAAVDQWAVDRRLLELDGTPHKDRLGANALLGVSLATARAAAVSSGLPLYEHVRRLAMAAAAIPYEQIVGAHGGPADVAKPVLSDAPHFTPLAAEGPRMPLPMTNMISGGLHAGGNLDFQDVLVMPIGAASYAEGLQWIVRIYRRLGALLDESGYEGRLVGDEGGYGPRLGSNREAIELVTRAIEAADLEPGHEVTIALDVAATHFFDGEFYHLAATGGQRMTSSEMIDVLAEFVDAFPVESIEDALADEDWSGWQELTARLGSRVRLVGDDLFATHPERVRRGIEMQAANCVLIKPNQVGTLSETLATMHLAESAGMGRVVSARSGETEDDTIADLAVGTAAEGIKIGSIVRGERLVKYNRLLRIESAMQR